MWCELLNVSDGAWYVDLGVLAGILTSLAVIWRVVLWPGLKAFWAAIVAAPKIAEGVGRVVELVEGDVLSELNDVKVTLRTHITEADNRDIKISEHEQRLGKLEEAMFRNEKGC